MNLEDKYIIAGFGALSSVIVYLWRHMATATQRTEKKLDACEAKHDARDIEHRALIERVARVEGRHEGIEALADRVLAAIVSKK